MECELAKRFKKILNSLNAMIFSPVETKKIMYYLFETLYVHYFKLVGECIHNFIIY